MPFSLSQGCGLDWTLPQAHFEGVDEQGYVAYWEKIGQADLGDGLIIPVHINFNSHRETSSPTLGKGWMLPLLESHVEPVDENTVHVIMPDGWTFVFYRNGNTDTWRGNAGWIGQTDGARFTATAPCGWQVKFDAGKIQEIDSPKNRTITIKYNGPAPVEADIDNQPFVQVAQNTTTGAAESITIANQKIAISQAPRPRIQATLGKSFITGLDPSLGLLQWTNGKKELFGYNVQQSLVPTLTIEKPNQVQRQITWDGITERITKDGPWNYVITGQGTITAARTDTAGRSESYSSDAETGITIDKQLDGTEKITKRFVSGPLIGKTRTIEIVSKNTTRVVYSASFDEAGRIIREIGPDLSPSGIPNGSGASHLTTYKYDEQGRAAEVLEDGKPVLTKSYDKAGRLVEEKYLTNNVVSRFFYPADGTASVPCADIIGKAGVSISKNIAKIEIRYDPIFGRDILLYNQNGGVTYKIDRNNNLFSYAFDALGRQAAMYKNSILIERDSYSVDANSLTRNQTQMKEMK